MSAPTVVRVITWLPVGGIERRLVAVLPKLRELGWAPRLVCVREEGPLGAEVRDAGIPLTVIPFRSRLSPGSLRRLAAFLREHRAQVVHSHMYRSNVPGTIAGRMARVPAVFAQVHNVGTWESARQVAVDRFLTRWRHGTIAVSKAVQADVMARLRLPEERVPVLYNGIDMEKFVLDSPARARLRAEWGAVENQPALLVPARLHSNKNPLGVVKAFREAAAALGEVRPLLVFAGDGGLEAPLREAVGDAEDIRLIGRRDDMQEVYTAADAIILSSFKEGFSNAVIEALACGKPVIASRVGGNAEAVSEARFGWIHEAGDHAALVAQITGAARKGVAGLAAMASDCRSRAEDFSLDALVRNTHQLYCEALGRTP